MLWFGVLQKKGHLQLQTTAQVGPGITEGAGQMLCAMSVPLHKKIVQPPLALDRKPHSPALATPLTRYQLISIQVNQGNPHPGSSPGATLRAACSVFGG